MAGTTLPDPTDINTGTTEVVTLAQLPAVSPDCEGDACSPECLVAGCAWAALLSPAARQ